MVSIADLIKKQPCRPVVVGDQDIGVAVVVDITKGCAATDFEKLESLAGRARDIDELSSAVIMKELIRRAQGISVPLACQLRQKLNGPIRNKQIEPPIVVIIEEQRAEAGESMSGHSQPRLAGAVLKQGSTQIRVERIGLVH